MKIEVVKLIVFSLLRKIIESFNRVSTILLKYAFWEFYYVKTILKSLLDFKKSINSYINYEVEITLINRS